ncbi:MAG: hypothetical protein M0026_10670 [Nocardiopsaceae bacterium]|nr:hypothetical protein [Nocardiopsaceae bacterium]
MRLPRQEGGRQVIGLRRRGEPVGEEHDIPQQRPRRNGDLEVLTVLDRPGIDVRFRVIDLAILGEEPPRPLLSGLKQSASAP